MEAFLVVLMIVAIDLAIISGLWVATALCKAISDNPDKGIAGVSQDQDESCDEQ
ncbi:MAG: hypothetical protein ACYSWP_10105 [Planctomycetota bacterium]